MDWPRFKIAIAATKPETVYRVPSGDEEAGGGPKDAASGRYLAIGEEVPGGAETSFGRFPARYEGLVRFSLERCDQGRCAECRDNARVRYMVRATDQHGIKKWCAGCLMEKLAIEAPA